MAELSDNTLALELPHLEIARFCDRFGVASFALFGSVLRQDFGADSDVDVLLTFKAGRGFTFENTPEIDEELRRIFRGRPVDVVEVDHIRNPLRRAAILENHRVIYVA